MIPTSTSAPTVHADVNVPKNPEKNNATMNRIPTTIGMIPVLAPALIPVVDSMNDVVVDVPQTAPATVATASHVSALLPFLRCPFSSIIPAAPPTPMRVPAVSNMSTTNSETAAAMNEGHIAFSNISKLVNTAPKSPKSGVDTNDSGDHVGMR